MRYTVRWLKNLELTLKEAEPAFRNVRINGSPILENGRPYRNFGDMLPRELAANWLVAAVLDHCAGSSRFHIMSDPAGGDGLIFDTTAERALWTEHVLVISRAGNAAKPGDRHEEILKCVSKKNKRGRTYGRDRHLVIFLYRSGNPGPWWPTKLARALPRPFNFETAWLVCFQHFEGDDRVYAVSCLDASQGHAPTWLVRIDSSFRRWAVCEIQAARGPTHAPWAYNTGILAPSGEAPVAILPPVRSIRRPSLKQIVRFSTPRRQG
jgi:hypothetical protein